MDLLRVEAALLRAQLPELTLRPGMTLPARVMERHGRMGLLLLAGTPLSAQLPDELKAGDRLRLRVEDVGEQIVLRTVEAPAARQPATSARCPPGSGSATSGGGAGHGRGARGARARRGGGAAARAGRCDGLPATVRVVARPPKPRVDLYA